MFTWSRARESIASIASILFLSFFLGSCASFDRAKFREDPGFLYGYGTGDTRGGASDAAMIDLIMNAQSRVDNVVAKAMIPAFKLPKMGPIVDEKNGTVFTVVYKYQKASWDKAETARQSALRAELKSAFAGLRTAGDKTPVDRVVGAGKLLVRLYGEGVFMILTESESGSALLSSVIQSYCLETARDVGVTVDPAEGFASDSSKMTIAMTLDGKPAASMPLAVTWKAVDATAFPVKAMTDGEGKATIDFPATDSFKDRMVSLLVAPAYGTMLPESPFLKELETDGAKEFKYRHYGDTGTAYPVGTKVNGGPFTAGALKNDKRAEKKETPRTVVTKALLMDVYPVTNAQYAIYLMTAHIDPSEYPEYWENPDYNAPEQPVIGVSLEMAAKYAEWLSGQLGVTKRLPSENEWEKAARGGFAVIYPWGDQLPSDGVRANYNGNGKFKGTSPVNSFENGKNAFGLYDMAGNVAQWTTTEAEASWSAAPGNVVVKGGSWMDGISDLRVSARRDLDPSKGYGDVGFRLVTEVENE